MVATLVKRNREIRNVNNDIKKQTNFVKMFFCENDTENQFCYRTG